MTRLLQVVPYLHPRAGGPPVVVNRHSSHLAESGWEVTIVTTDLFCEGNSGALAEQVDGAVELHVLETDRPRWRGLSSRAKPVLSREVPKADIVHVHTLWHSLTPRVRRLCRRFDKPYLMMPHGMLDPYSLGVRRLRKALYLAAFERANLTRAERIVYTTEPERQLAESSLSGLPAPAIVPLGADAPPTADRAALAEDFLESFPAARSRRRLLFLSRVHPKKGLDRLLAILPALVARDPDLLLVVAGSGEAEHMASVRRAIDELAIGRSVVLCGRLDGRLKWGAYAAADCFVLPSRQENFGLVVAEAMQMGIPVVVSDRVNSCDHVERARAGIVCDAADPDALVAAIVECLERSKDMGLRGAAWARRELTWERSTRLIENCYREVLAGS